jgi:hypothetical protein
MFLVKHLSTFYNHGLEIGYNSIISFFKIKDFLNILSTPEPAERGHGSGVFFLLVNP